MSRLLHHIHHLSHLIAVWLIVLHSVLAVPIGNNRAPTEYDYNNYYNVPEPVPGGASVNQQYLPGNKQADTGGYGYVPVDYIAQQNGNPTMDENIDWVDRTRNNVGVAQHTADYQATSGQADEFQSPPKFETLLTEDNTGDYMNYNNNYDINTIHTADQRKTDHIGHKHEHSFKGNGIEKDVGTRDEIAHDPAELEAVAMRAIGHHHNDGTDFYQDSKFDEYYQTDGHRPQYQGYGHRTHQSNPYDDEPNTADQEYKPLLNYQYTP